MVKSSSCLQKVKILAVCSLIFNMLNAHCFLIDPSDTPPVVTCPDSCNCIGPSMVRCDGRRDVEIL